MNFISTTENVAEILRKFLKFLTDCVEVLYAIIGIDIDIDTREKYRYLSIPESIDKYRYFSHH